MPHKVLRKNVINTWGEKGRDWLEQLPKVIEALSAEWRLTDLKPVSNMSYNYVALAVYKQKIPVVLKISCDAALIVSEYQALQNFDGHGAIRALDINMQHNALLLGQAVPGTLLKTYRHKAEKNIIPIYANLVNEISSCATPKDNFTHVGQWCEAIDRIKDRRIEERCTKKARALREYLLGSSRCEYLCHGDLHLENIIKHGEKWVSIDPKGIIGEVAFEAAAFDIISKNEMTNPENMSALIMSRATALAKALGLDFHRLLSWFFLRAIISAQWFIEDHGDPGAKLCLLKTIYPWLES